VQFLPDTEAHFVFLGGLRVLAVRIDSSPCTGPRFPSLLKDATEEASIPAEC
jgi:hypothetical protein